MPTGERAGIPIAQESWVNCSSGGFVGIVSSLQHSTKPSFLLHDTEHISGASIVLHNPTGYTQLAGRSQTHQVVPGHEWIQMFCKHLLHHKCVNDRGSIKGSWDGGKISQSSCLAHDTRPVSEFQQSGPSTTLQLLAELWNQEYQK